MTTEKDSIEYWKTLFEQVEKGMHPGPLSLSMVRPVEPTLSRRLLSNTTDVHPYYSTIYVRNLTQQTGKLMVEEQDQSETD